MDWERGGFACYLKCPFPLWMMVMNYGAGQRIFFGSDLDPNGERAVDGGDDREEALRRGEQLLLDRLLAEPGYGS